MDKIVIKKLVTHQNKSKIFWVFAGVFLALYFITGVIYNGQAGFFMLTPLEWKIPLIPWTIWIYISIYPMCYYMFQEIDDEYTLNYLNVSYLVLLFFSGVIFYFYPVSYPREFFLLSIDNSMTSKIFHMVRLIDSPLHCFPSLHVATVFLFSFMHLQQSKKKFSVFFIYSLMIAISTLTTKQHYLYDIVAGFFLSLLIYLGVKRVFKFKDEN